MVTAAPLDAVAVVMSRAGCTWCVVCVFLWLMYVEEEGAKLSGVARGWWIAW